MTKEEYDNKKAEIKKRLENELLELDEAFALSHNTVKIGDIISDNAHTIQVQKFVVERPSMYQKYPSLYYEGIRLTKSLKPFKSGEMSCVYVVKNHIKQS